jgi:TonB family protein
MKHGIDSYFFESAHARRRVSLTTASVAVALLAPFLLLTFPQVRSRVLPKVRRIVRFGYEGKDRPVEQIELDVRPGYQKPLQDVGKVSSIPSRKGGEGLRPAPVASRAGPHRPSNLPGVGESETDVFARSRARLSNVPLVQSEDLVIEQMEPPVYPEDLHAKGIEGRVALMALVDTTGRVAEVTVVQSSGELAFEQSAAEAVRMARFRPYRIEGQKSEVYAVIRYRFRLY